MATVDPTQSTTDRPIVLSAHTGPWIWVNQYIIHIFMQCALKIICVFSVIIHQNIDPKSTENPDTWRAARMHDVGIAICCGQDHRQKKHPDSTVWWAGIQIVARLAEWVRA